MTVAELIAELQKYPPDQAVWIEDADTDWLLPVHVGPYGQYSTKQVDMPEACYLYGKYDEAVK